MKVQVKNLYGRLVGWKPREDLLSPKTLCWEYFFLLGEGQYLFC